MRIPFRPLAAAALALTLPLTLGQPALAGTKTEVHHLKGKTVTLHLPDFLHADEVKMLQLLASNSQTLEMLVPKQGGYSAIAVAPAEGFLRGGQPVESASALGGFKSAEAARAGAIAHCDKLRKSGPDCVVVLEVSP